ncbi:hypothetical protein HPULCUR_011357 [Helicostylum pulchrum]|uniref:CCHC-type domain-containing protein n=1 Tax=Helicostylum pulchrum TaxID=562976 RepID=A0ABP9YFU7_9FUNG
MDIKLAIPGMTDDEGCDKFIRGLISKQMRSHIRQYEANTLKEAIHAALAFDSAQYEEDSFNNSKVRKQQVVDDPMELDAIDDRNYQRPRNNNNNNNYSRSQNYSSGYSRGQSSSGYSRDRNYRPNNYSRNNSSGSTASCYYCHKTGHMKRNCRTRFQEIG